MKHTISELKTFLILWATQSLSQLGSAMTSFALTLWLYQKTGSALQTALLSICSYAPYVVLSIFAGALSDLWDKKKTMLGCDTFAACCTLGVLFLLKTDLLRPVHLYILNAVTGLMNTVQQPASEVAMTLITPKKHYQKTSGLTYFSNSLVTILNPVLATAVFAFAGVDGVILCDLATFLLAFVVLALFIKIPDRHPAEKRQESVLRQSRAGLAYLKKNRMILDLILFLAGVNLVASAFNAVLPAMILPRKTGSEAVLGMVTSCAGIASLVGSVLVTLLPKPKNRVRVIYLTMLFSLGTENFVIALSESPLVWCGAQFLGWVVVPIMGASLNVVLRGTIPVEMQGRVYACRNTLQFFTIPIGFFLGGFLVDQVCEPMMARNIHWLSGLFGIGKGSGASLVMFLLGIAGVAICLVFGQRLNRYHFEESV